MWYIIDNGQQVGPLQKEQLRNYNLTPQSMVWSEGMANWEPAANVPELADLFRGPGPAYGPQPGQPPYGAQPPYGQDPYPIYQDKSRTTTGILALLLGGLGIQYFYLGKTGAGLLTILLSIVTCGVWEVVTFIQGIIILCMNDQEFNRKFVNNPKFFPLF
ncbi:MAG: DUF4339 domain-containing protein [Muribaculaceae bacterium]|nr:DUF4339 domain-containing protein [Muribaculaceae bacterium]